MTAAPNLSYFTASQAALKKTFPFRQRCRPHSPLLLSPHLCHYYTPTCQGVQLQLLRRAATVCACSDSSQFPQRATLTPLYLGLGVVGGCLRVVCCVAQYSFSSSLLLLIFFHGSACTFPVSLTSTPPTTMLLSSYEVPLFLNFKVRRR